MMNKKSIRSTGKDSLYDYMVKLIIIGDSGVGKTNILTRFCEDVFKDTHVATIGVDFNVRTIQVEDKKLRLQIWDTAGQQRFKTITQTYYKGAAGILLVYAVDCRESFESIEKWISQVSQRTSSSVKKMLIANKVDVETEKRQVSQQEGEAMAQKYHLLYMEVSAKQNSKVDEVFHMISREIKQKLDEEGKNELDNLSRTITLGSSFEVKNGAKDQNGERKKCAC